MDEFTEPSPVDLLQLAAEAEVCVDTLMQDLYERGAELLYDHYLDDKNDPFIVTQASTILINAIEIQHVRYDIGETAPWQEDEEPTPCIIDTWGRAVVPIKKKYKLIQESSPASMVKESSYRSYKSSITRKSQALKSKKSPTPLQTQMLQEERNFQIIPLPELKETSSDVEDLLRMSKELEIKRRKEDEDRIRKDNLAEQHRIKEATRRAQEMKEMPYTFDYEGHLMLVKELSNSERPNEQTEFLLSSSPELTSTPNKKKLARILSRKKLPTVQLKRAPQSEFEFVRNVQSSQPPLFDSIILSPGVKIGEGHKYRTSPLKPKHHTLTRSQYNQFADPRGVLSQSSYSSSIKSRHEGKESIRAETFKSQVFASHPDLMSEIPDIDDEETYDIVQSPRPLRASTKSLAAITQFGEGAEEVEGMSEVDKFNFQILRSKNWGSNTPIKEPTVTTRLPNRPSLKNLHETYGLRSKLPRERPFIATGKSHMAATQFGMTIGHGLLSGQSAYLSTYSSTRTL